MTVLSIHHRDGVATFDESDNVVDVIDVDGSDAVRVYYPDNSYDDYYHATITNVRFEWTATLNTIQALHTTMMKGEYPKNRYNFDYKPVDKMKGRTYAKNLQEARYKLVKFIKDEHGKIDESQLKIEEIVF